MPLKPKKQSDNILNDKPKIHAENVTLKSTDALITSTEKT